MEAREDKNERWTRVVTSGNNILLKEERCIWRLK
jgi:hypothetical protein